MSYHDERLKLAVMATLKFQRANEEVEHVKSGPTVLKIRVAHIATQLFSKASIGLLECTRG
jgi:hypothetical protein